MTTPSRCQGFALMLAVFLIVTLAAVAVYVLTISTTQTEASAQEEKAARAYQAARTGLEWAAYQVLRSNADCATLHNQTLVLQQGLAGYRVSVLCTSSSENEGPTALQVFQVTATGCNGASCPLGAPDMTYVERQLHLTLAR
jgi:MSHA biogenesis protein MshP